MNYRTTISDAQRRIELAKEVRAEYLGYESRNPEGLTVRKFGEYVVIEDGATAWLSSLEDHEDAVERLVADVLDGEVLGLPSPDDEEDWAEYRACLYSRFCTDYSECTYDKYHSNDLEAVAALPASVQGAIVEWMEIGEEFRAYTKERATAEKQRKERHAEKVELAKSKLGDLTGYTADFRGTGKLIAPDTEDGRILASEALTAHLGGFDAEAAESDCVIYAVEDLTAEQVEHLLDFGWCLAGEED